MRSSPEAGADVSGPAELECEVDMLGDVKRQSIHRNAVAMRFVRARNEQSGSLDAGLWDPLR